MATSDQRALGRAQGADPGVGVDAAAQRRQRLGRRRARPPPRDQAGAAAVPGERGHVLGHGHRVDEAQVLVDEADRQRLRDRVHRAAAQRDPAGIRAVDPGQDLDQGRLAGAVLAEQRVHLARHDIEVDLGQRLRTGEPLAQAGYRQQRLHGSAPTSRPTARGNA
ncbi:MAG TPA: hypothetical protein VFY87_01440, partial [Geminicoccaceae bacterium]|nr:hypothetical protein [Geminicoccaceae bacterium]